MYAEATILDPKFKKYGFLNDSSFTESKKIIINKATTIHIEMKNTMPPAIQNQSVTLGGDSIWNDFDEKVN